MNIFIKHMSFNCKLVLLTIVVLSIGCVQDKKIKVNEGPEIYTTLPVELDTFSSGSYVKINGVVGDNDGVHDVSIKIYSSDSTTEYKNVFFDHIHDPLFNIDTSFTAFAKAGSTSTFTVNILAVDMMGYTSSNSISLIVVGDNSK